MRDSPDGIENNLGPAGEARAEAHLRAKGYRVLERGFRAPFGELDLVCLDRGTLVFVEVKARSSGRFGGPQLAVNRAKQVRIAKTAAAFLKARRPACEAIRFDVVALGPEGIDHIENAFESPLRFTL